MTRRIGEQQKLEIVMLEQLVKPDHLLRKIEKHINFNFIYGLVKEFYSQERVVFLEEKTILFSTTSGDLWSPFFIFKTLFINYRFILLK